MPPRLNIVERRQEGQQVVIRAKSPERGACRVHLRQSLFPYGKTSSQTSGSQIHVSHMMSFFGLGFQAGVARDEIVLRSFQALWTYATT